MAARGAIRRGFSTATDPVTAVREFSEAIAQEDIALIVFFCSFSFDLNVLEPELRRAFDGLHVIGCTTAGEIAPIGYLDGAITGFSIASSHCRAVSTGIENLSQFQMSDGHAVTQTLISSMSEKGLALDPKDTFAMLLIDGKSGNEEVVLAAIHLLMDMVPLLGGSAGDNMSLTGAFVYFDGAFHRDAALLTVIKIRAPFRIVKCQHLVGSEMRMVVTRADPLKRKVFELNAEPAAREYARAQNVPECMLAPAVFSAFPLMVKVGGDFHVRSIQAAHEDGSLSFFCAIDEGVVLRLARTEAILPNLAALFQSVRAEIGPPTLIIGFDCIHRGLALEQTQSKRLAGELLAANNVIGFSTYGEQFGGMHLNQTFTAVAIGAPYDIE
ncbi:FIST domain containing protein [Methylocella tundrae]|uniref:FIST domain containing protein n=1 Tax=Methylocella tundrae TaxID=227605 RepID=A0A8B6M8N7_METTU|nr:FIST N-terminal domain-containing protein [Methylocella tundrae]VTZ24552.1 FIST domain containing protein [Methylocella tundrae]VTZ51258.1 FIST domain containing protein [Methylocella tundrae]